MFGVKALKREMEYLREDMAAQNRRIWGFYRGYFQLLEELGLKETSIPAKTVITKKAKK